MAGVFSKLRDFIRNYFTFERTLRLIVYKSQVSKILLEKQNLLANVAEAYRLRGLFGLWSS